MLQNTFPYSNKLKINLYTRLDDGKDPKYEINDKTKNELKEKIKNELEKDLKFEIDDKTKNELKEKIKNELEKDLKFKIGDKTKNELKEKIKNELEKDLKFEIDDKTKNELKEKIKNELEKDLKFEIDDKIKNELKEKIKNELEKDLKFEIDDKIKNELKEKIKNELEKDLKFEIDDKTKNEIKDKIKKEIEDEIDCKRDKNGRDKGDKDKDGFNKDSDDKDGKKEKDSDDKDGKKEKDSDDKDGKKEKDSDDKDGDDKVIEGKLVNLGHIDKEMCGENAEKYSAEKHVGKPAWFTRDLLKQFLPDLMKNDKIMSHFDSKSEDQYHAQNFGITFRCQEDEECGKNINFTFAAPSNMWCNKGGAKGAAGLQCREEIRSINTSACCPTAVPYSSPINSENFFLNEKCPNLILDLPLAKLRECEGKTIVAKLEAPMVIVTKDGSIIDKAGYKIAQHKYAILKDRLNYKGEIKDSTGKSPQQLEEVKESVERGLWSSDKEVKLKIPALPSYSPGANDNQDETFFYYDNEAECKEEVLQAKAEAEKLKIQVQEDGHDEYGFNEKGCDRRDEEEVLSKNAFAYNSTQEANLNYYDNEDNSVSVDTNFI
ncbi:hypothetical protein [Wolbachia endosymbiont of Spodoptera picta]|uniref:hypothetical protein n=1 Tax=Wolbachia endosymbiont of Spodoptera picta TaxID=2769078 RepID=UPI001FE464D9|nr:hypothetical protein [Wolbachia endosymbiont of Spodoptera picta]